MTSFNYTMQDAFEDRLADLISSSTCSLLELTADDISTSLSGGNGTPITLYVNVTVDTKAEVAGVVCALNASLLLNLTIADTITGAVVTNISGATTSTLSSTVTCNGDPPTVGALDLIGVSYVGGGYCARGAFEGATCAIKCKNASQVLSGTIVCASDGAWSWGNLQCAAVYIVPQVSPAIPSSPPPPPPPLPPYAPLSVSASVMVTLQAASVKLRATKQYQLVEDITAAAKSGGASLLSVKVHQGATFDADQGSLSDTDAEAALTSAMCVAPYSLTSCRVIKTGLRIPAIAFCRVRTPSSLLG